MVMMYKSFVIVFFVFSQITASENIPATKVFVLPIEPSLFNWTLNMGDDFVYRASLLNAPDLPNWIEYLYSKQHKTGFLYGVPPKDQKDLEIEIIALNKRNYETRRRVIHLKVENKLEPATHQVHLKIDNLNVEDFFDVFRMSRLLNIFKYKLWKESFFDLYFTFMTSAVSLGARLPLRPTEGEGVVVRLGSTADFSNTLVELQEEVKPLWKLQSCPRDFKRTTVERIFRDEGFILDWCNFRLIPELPKHKPMDNLLEGSVESELLKEPLWSRFSKAEVSRRSYTDEFAFTILVPVFILILLVVFLSVVLGIQREGVSKRKSHTSEVSASQFMGNPVRPSSGVDTFTSELKRNSRCRTPAIQSASRPVVLNGITRPTPPPYVGTLRTTVVDF